MIISSNKKSIFERLPSSNFVPCCTHSTKRIIVSRNGMVFSSSLDPWHMIYSMPKAQLLSPIVGSLSLMRRGWRRLDRDKVFGFVHSPWSAGYYHWVTESLPRAHILKMNFPSAIPLLPSEKFARYRESLEAIGFDDVETFPDARNVSTSNAVLTDAPRRFATTSPSLLKSVRETIRRNLGIVPAEDPSLLVYVSRKKSRGRIVANEDELMESLSDLDVVEVAFEDLSFSEQVELMSRTRILIGIHGAGLTNSMFLPEGAGVIELIPRRHSVFDFNAARMSFQHDACYKQLAADMELNYDYIEGRADTKAWRQTHMADIEINANIFRKKVELALQKT